MEKNIPSIYIMLAGASLFSFLGFKYHGIGGSLLGAISGFLGAHVAVVFVRGFLTLILKLPGFIRVFPEFWQDIVEPPSPIPLVLYGFVLIGLIVLSVSFWNVC